jgi:hypothetical protein
MSGAADIRGWARDISRFGVVAPGEAIDVVDEAITDQLRRDTGGDGAFSRGRKLGKATTRVTARPGEAQVSASGSTAVWSILEDGTTAHTVTAKRGKVLRTPYGPRSRVQVGGVPPRHTFTRGAEAGLDAAEAELERLWGQV